MGWYAPAPHACVPVLTPDADYEALSKQSYQMVECPLKASRIGSGPNLGPSCPSGIFFSQHVVKRRGNVPWLLLKNISTLPVEGRWQTVPASPKLCQEGALRLYGAKERTAAQTKSCFCLDGALGFAEHLDVSEEI